MKVFLYSVADHLLYSRKFEPLDARVIEADRSDHLPVVATCPIR